MREIKFRAYQPHRSLTREPGMYSVTDIALYSEYGGGEAFLGNTGTSEFFEDIHLMQFTGLHDKNGKEIYEGDILADHMDSMGREVDEPSLGQVEFRDGRFSCGPDISVAGRAPFFDYSECEIVGNIYENPELLDD